MTAREKIVSESEDRSIRCFVISKPFQTKGASPQIRLAETLVLQYFHYVQALGIVWEVFLKTKIHFNNCRKPLHLKFFLCSRHDYAKTKAVERQRTIQ